MPLIADFVPESKPVARKPFVGCIPLPISRAMTDSTSCSGTPIARIRAAAAVLLAMALMGLPSVLQATGADGPSVADRWDEDPTQIFDAADVDLAELQWLARPVVVFANTPRDPAFVEQMEELLAEIDRLVERDVILIVDTDPDAASELRRKLRPRGFMLTLIGKDGQVKLRKPLPWTVRELSRSIDKMPMRRREMRENPSASE